MSGKGLSKLAQAVAGVARGSGREQLDRLEIGDVAAYPLAGVELHEGLGGEWIAQGRDADAVDDGVTHLEIAEADRQLGRTDGVHVGGLAHLVKAATMIGLHAVAKVEPKDIGSQFKQPSNGLLRRA